MNSLTNLSKIEAKTAVTVHTNKDGKKHHHEEAEHQHKNNDKKDDCCNDKVLKISQTDKAAPQLCSIAQPIYLYFTFRYVDILKRKDRFLSSLLSPCICLDFVIISLSKPHPPPTG